MRSDSGERPAATPEGEGSEFSVSTAVSILRRYARFGILIGVSAGLLVHLGTAFAAARAETVYAATFEVRYRAGTSLLQGLSHLVGRDLPSLRDRSTIETQLEILGSRRLRKAALARVKSFEGLSPEELTARTAHLSVSFAHRSNTDIIAATVNGGEPTEVQEFAEAVLAEFHA